MGAQQPFYSPIQPAALGQPARTGEQNAMFPIGAMPTSRQGSAVPGNNPQAAMQQLLANLAQQGANPNATMSPQQQAALQQALLNPHMNDEFTNSLTKALIPGGPEGILMGGVGGIGVAGALYPIFKEGTHGSNALIRSATWIDNLPGIRKISQYLDKKFAIPLRNTSPIQEIGFHIDTKTMTKHHLGKLFSARQTTLPPEVLNRLLRADTVEGATKRIQSLLRSQTDKKVKHTLRGLLRGVRSLENQFLNVHHGKAQLFQQLAKQDVGFIGRLYANSLFYIKRIFGGHTIGMGKSTVTKGASSGLNSFGNLLGKMLGPFLAGGVIFGLAIGEAKQAEKGDKLKAFMHSLFGIGIGQFIGWEVGKAVLKPLMNSFFPKLSSKLLFGKLARFLPFIGRCTLGGTIVELAAMLIVAYPFQKAGEWVAHKFFGKPKKESDEENRRQGIYPATKLPVSLDAKQTALKHQGFQSFIDHRNTRLTPNIPDTPSDQGQSVLDSRGEVISLNPQEIMKSPAADTYAQELKNIKAAFDRKQTFPNIFDSSFFNS